MLPSLNALRAFEAVARHRSFTSAAEEIGVSQPAISLQIRKLEAFFDVPLFIRDGNHVDLTPIGKILFIDLSRGIGLVKKAVTAAQAEVTTMPLWIILKPHFAMRWLAPRLPAFSESHPNLNIRFVHANLPVDQTEFDFHLSIDFRRFDDIDDEYILLMNGDLTPACSPKLLDGPQGLTQPSDLAFHKLLHESRERTWPEWLEKAGVGDLEPASKVYYDDTNVRQQAAIAGEGVALVCPNLITEELSTGRLVCPFELKLNTYSYYLRLPQHLALNKNVQLFVRWIESQKGIAFERR